MSDTTEIRVPAIEVEQSPGQLLYTFAVDGKQIPCFATVSRIRRNHKNELNGYQRPEVLSHIAEIKRYIESENPMIPNSLVIAFDTRVRFEPIQHSNGYGDKMRIGTLIIPFDSELPSERKPGFIVDGQQRLAAIRDSSVTSFSICVTAFITNDVRKQTEQFILVNSTKPLPKGLIYELLPCTDTRLSSLLQRRRFPSQILSRLNHEEGSPLKGMIQTPTTPTGTVRDNSLLKMIENSLSDGILYRFKGANGNDGDISGMLAVLRNYWRAVSDVFKEAWGLPPRRSRLMHGAGIVSLGFLMDAIGDRQRESFIPSIEQFADDLRPLKPVCRWTDGYWDFGPGCQRKWNDIQNVPKDIQLLSNYLLIQYKAIVWNSSTKQPASANIAAM